MGKLGVREKSLIHQTPLQRAATFAIPGFGTGWIPFPDSSGQDDPVDGVPGGAGNFSGQTASSTLTNTHIFVGNGSNVATDVAMSGEITITNTGVTTFGLHSLTAKTTPVGADEFVLSDSAASFTNKKITFTNLLSAISTGVTPTLTATEIGFGSGTNTLTGSSALTWDDTNGSMTAGGRTVTTSNPILNLSQTWNAGAVTFTGIKLNITNTASVTNTSLIQDWQVGGSSVASVGVNGFVTIGPIVAGKFPNFPNGAAGSTQIQHVIRIGSTVGAGLNVAVVQNLDATGYSALNYADNNGDEHAAIGYGNATAAGAIFRSCLYIEASTPTGSYPDMKFISTVTSTGPTYTLRANFASNGQLQFFRSQSGNAESAHMGTDGTWLFSPGASSGASPGTACVIHAQQTAATCRIAIDAQNSTATYAALALGSAASLDDTLSRTGSSWTPSGQFLANQTNLIGNKAGGLNVMANDAAGIIYFCTAGSATTNVRSHILANGNFHVGPLATAVTTNLLNVTAGSTANTGIRYTKATIAAVYLGVGGSNGMIGTDATTFDFKTGISGATGDTSGGTVRMSYTSAGNIIINTAAISTSATDGFLYIASCAGAATGTPTSFTGRVPMVYDTTNNTFNIYNGGWKKVTLT